MARFILRYSGSGEVPSEDLARIRRQPDVRVVDQSARMLLVEGPPDGVSQLAGNLPQWSCSPETFVGVPDPRPKPDRPPG